MDATRNGSGWAVEALCEAAAGSLGAGRPPRPSATCAARSRARRACAHTWSSSWAARGHGRRARGGPPAERGRGIRDRRARAARQRPRRGPRPARPWKAGGGHRDPRSRARAAGEEDDELTGRLRAARAAPPSSGSPSRTTGRCPTSRLTAPSMPASGRCSPSTPWRAPSAAGPAPRFATLLSARWPAAPARGRDGGRPRLLPAFAPIVAEDLQTAEAALTAAVEDARAARCSASRTPRTCARSRSCSAGGSRTRPLMPARRCAVERHGWRPEPHRRRSYSRTA